MSHALDSNRRVRLRHGVCVAPAGEGRWQIRWDFDEVSFLEGPACDEILPWLVPRLDGTRTTIELLEAADRPCSQQALEEVLLRLAENCCLSDADAPDNGLAEALDGLGVDSAAALGQARRMRVVVCGRSPLAELVLSVTRSQGLVAELLDAAEPLDALHRDEPVLPLVIESDWPAERLEALNDGALDRRRDWMLVGAWNRRVLVGPIFVPGETACYVCYRRRLDSHRQHRTAYQARDGWRRGQSLPVESQAVLPALASLAAAWTGLELFSHLSGASVARTRGNVLVYYPDETRLDVERVLRIPWCPKCATLRSEHGVSR